MLLNSLTAKREGFETINRKPVTVPDQAQKKARVMCDDEDIRDELMAKNVTPLGGFATASGKPVIVSDDALKQARNLWNDEDVADHLIPTNPTPMGGFATASGKPVSVSEEALKKAKGLWNDDDEDVGGDLILKTPTPMGGFATASGKPVIVSDDALKKARGLWNDEEVGDELIPKNATPMGGFTTASGKPVSVSEEALKKAKGLWNDEGVGDELFPKNATPMGGFATASGKPVSVSEEALRKVKGLWNDEDVGDDLILKTLTPMGGFATASGKPVNVSEEALKKAKGLWNDEDVGGDLILKTPTPMGGFATASGKPFNVSEEALRKAKGLWNDEDVVDQLIPKNSTTNGGFATASGIAVSVSEDALVKARRLWDDSVDGSAVSKSNVCDEDMAQEVPNKFCEKKKKKGFVTPFRTAGPQSTLQVNTSSNKITPVLQGPGRHPGLVKSSAGTKGLGMRAVRSAESLKRSRNLLYDIGNNNSSCKTPKMNCTSSPNAFISPRKLNSEPVASATSSVLETLSPQDSCSSNINISSVTDSQMDEVLESSKALLEDADFDFNSDETRSKCMDTNTSYKPEPVQPIPISSITSDDNPVRLIHAVIARSYPVVYSCKPLVGKSVFISQSCYEKLESLRESTNELEREKLFTQIQTECANARKSKQQVHLHSFKKENLEKLTIDQLLDIVDSGDDFCDIRPLLSKQKLNQLEEAHTKKHEELHREIHKEVEIRMQNLVPGYTSISAVKKIRLVDLSDMKRYREMVSQGLSPPRHAVLSLWRPSDDWQTGLVEGIAVEILLANTSQISHDEVKLNSARGTWIRPLSKEYPPLSQDDISQFRRHCASFEEIINSSTFRPPFSEFDVVGLIVKVESPAAENRMGEPCQTVYLADPQKRILSLKFWKSVVDEGLASLVQVGNFVAVSNVQWRESRSAKEKIPAGFVQETTRFSLGPKESPTNEELHGLKDQIKDARSHVSACVDRIYNILNDVEEDEDNMEKTPPLKRRLQPYNPPNSAVRKNLMDAQEFA